MPILLADTHVHIDPVFDAAEQLRSARRALLRAGKAAGCADPQAVTALFLTERHDLHVFRAWRDGVGVPPGLRIEPLDASALRVSCAENDAVLLFSGRQIATRERLEVLALTVDEEFPDGRSLDETLERVRQCGAIPVVPWSPGKWLFSRRPLVERVLRAAEPGNLAVGDTALRPLGWGTPVLLRLAVERGLPCLAGTDPLPLPGEERRTGTYGVLLTAGFDPASPTASVRSALLRPSPGLRVIGRRAGPLEVGLCLWRHARRKEPRAHA